MLQDCAPAASWGAPRDSRLWLGAAVLLTLPGAALIGGGVLFPRAFSAAPEMCLMHRSTGLWCPLCGGTRATAALIHGDLPTALGYNPFALAIEIVALLVVLRWLLRRTRGAQGAFLTGWEATGLLVSMGAFFVVRNLPGMWVHMGPLLGPPG